MGVSVEGELGCLGSLETGKGEAEDGHGFEGELSTDMLLTDPEEAADFVEKTKVDALAIAIGTSHGAYKFTRKPTGEVIAISRIAEIHKALPNTHLVMHQDHGNEPSTCYSAAINGFTSVMMDGSLEADAKTPAS